LKGRRAIRRPFGCQAIRAAAGTVAPTRSSE